LLDTKIGIDMHESEPKIKVHLMFYKRHSVAWNFVISSTLAPKLQGGAGVQNINAAW